ncbi:MAG: DUF5671 domain-containing protein [Anaerolineales bacterium]|nr:DUF5671 domain-containing protein [Anaerolineales bacterium]MDW8161656.1 DUF5671 domain-containing protein [Anaerolineales bacterium]
MQVIRRLYFYAVALVSLETVIWGLIGLMRTVFSPPTLGATADRLAAPLAFVLVGLPVFLLHWRAVQRLAAQSAEEAMARIRATFFYVALLVTLLPAAQNALAFLSRTFTQAFGLESTSALLGGGQTLADNLIAVGVNLIFAVYFYQRNRENWSAAVCPSLSEAETAQLRENYADARRVSRYLWLGYSLALTVLGVRQLLAYLFVSPQTIGMPAAAMLANGYALLGVGLPIWFYTQRLIERSLTDRAESFSWLRMVFLLVLSWLSMFLTLYQIGRAVEVFLRLALGEGLNLFQVLQSLRPAVAVGIPMAVVWGFYGKQRRAAVELRQTLPLRAAINRFYVAVVASAALLAMILGSSRLLAFAINLLFGSESYFIEVGRGELSASLATLLLAIPVWLRYWRLLQNEARREDELGDEARRSVVRRGMLYLWIFVGVIGAMFATGNFFFEIIRALLATPSENFALDSLLRLRFTLIFLVVLVYHLAVLRRDQRLAVAALAARQAGFPVAIWIETDNPLARELKSALQREAPNLPLLWCDGSQQPSLEQLREAKAWVISARVFETSSRDEMSVWKSFAGQCIVLPDPQSQWYWIGGSAQTIPALAKQTARALRLLAEGQPLPRQTYSPVLATIAYVLAALFVLQFVSAILFVGIASLLD